MPQILDPPPGNTYGLGYYCGDRKNTHYNDSELLDFIFSMMADSSTFSIVAGMFT